MSRLDRYIATALLRDWLLVWVVFSAIFGLIAFIDELDRITASYRLHDALAYVLGMLPYRSMKLAPVIVLLGTILGLARLNHASELTAMRAAGMSPGRLLRAVAVPALALVLALLAATEYLVAPLYQKAATDRTVARGGHAALLRGQGLWSVDGNRFFNVRHLRHGKIPSDIYLYQFDDQGRLLQFLYAESAWPGEDRNWRLLRANQKTLEQGILHSRQRDELAMGPFWAPEELPVLPLPLQGMRISSLFAYVGYLKTTDQNWQQAEQMLWQKIALPLTSGAMVLLALPIGARLDTGRGGAFGRSLVAGSATGIGFYLLSQLIDNGGAVLQLPAPATAFLPALLVAAGAGLLLARMR
ncbi:MAG TPA: LPS export ABC transporter permease LptG [Gammaproteobacteria bacterium]|nr:LPS export ABC transporter permease LptG [Gammaproteobacteria bacterium]